MSDTSALDHRLDSAFADAQRRIQQLQQQASRSYEELQQRYERFLAVGERIGPNVVRPRVERLKARFPNVEETRSIQRHGGSLILSFKRTPGMLATVVLKLSVAHDEEVRNIIFQYDLEILPIFIQYERTNRLELPLEEATDDKLAAWLDDRLVSFVEIYLAMQFTEQYQHDNMVTDPVAEVRFPQDICPADRRLRGAHLLLHYRSVRRGFQEGAATIPGSRPR